MNSSSTTTSSNKTKNKLANGIVAARWFLILAFAIAIGVLGYFVSQFKIDASADTLLVKDNKLYIQTQVANQQFSPDEFILLAYEPTAHALFSQQTFDDISALSEKIRQLDRVKAVTSILTVPLINDTSALTGGTEVSSLTWQNQHYSPEVMENLVVDHPIFTDLLINRQGTATSIQIVFEENPELAQIESEMTRIQAQLLEGDLTPEQERRLSELKAKADPIKQGLIEQRKKEIEQLTQISKQVEDRANTYMGGSYVVGQHLIDIIKSDLTNFGLAISVVIALLLLFLYRSIKWVLFPLFSCAVSVLLTMGIFGFLDMRTTVISANFVALQLILTLAVMIHLIGAYREISRNNPAFSQRERVIATLNDKLAPSFFAMLTTSVGFGSLIFSGLQPVVDFGWMMLVSMLVTISVSLLLFPALLTLLPASQESSEYRFIEKALDDVKRMNLAIPKSVALVCILIFLGTALGISRLDVENSFIDYFDDDTQVHKELAFIDQQFGGSTPLDIILNVDQVNDDQELVLTADAVNRLQLVQAAVKAFEATGSVTSVANFTDLAKQLNDNKPLTEYELTTIYHILDKQVVNQLVGAYFSPDSQQLRISIRIQDTTAGLDRETFMNDLQKDLQAVGVERDEYQLTNLFVLYQDILSRLFDSQVTTLGIVYAVLALVLLLIFRSLKIALIALVPNILTTLGILGVIGWLGIPLDIMTITIAAIAMGIAVDDTIHFLHAYLQGRKDATAESNEASSASNRAFGHTGLAIVFTTTIITIGFSIFGLSNFLPSVYFGLLTATAMIFALITDLTLLPALLNWLVARPNKPQQSSRESN
ncbi:MMPL family transporter [Alteromonas pelagimontana]|uniref:MMPL family transporter n=1 Tax=Alteromonas pelagimontana TaxID=1858656 RepID=A0A6M4MGX4_9ALTE|nr:efflux RND transporter permease subunit [Alteromonas pelagimontana]QJR82302.1 MMPL family transporter [Alteromonas pelagimontana]